MQPTRIAALLSARVLPLRLARLGVPAVPAVLSAATGWTSRCSLPRGARRRPHRRVRAPRRQGRRPGRLDRRPSRRLRRPKRGACLADSQGSGCRHRGRPRRPRRAGSQGRPRQVARLPSPSPRTRSRAGLTPSGSAKRLTDFTGEGVIRHSPSQADPRRCRTRSLRPFDNSVRTRTVPASWRETTLLPKRRSF